MEIIKSIFWYNSYTLIGLLILLGALYLISKKLNLVETFPHEEGHDVDEDESNCVPNGKMTRTGVIVCEDGVCSNSKCCSHASLPRKVPLIGLMKCISFKEAQKIRGTTK